MSVDQVFLQKLESLFPGQASGPWYVYAGLIFQANDHMDQIKTLWEYLADSTPKQEDQFVKARKLRESLLKASVLVGFPKVHYGILSPCFEPTVYPDDHTQGINACTALRNAIQAKSPLLEEKLDADTSLRQHLQRPEKDARGREFFGRIYAQHTDRVLENMSLASGGDLSEFAINAVYGDLMAEETRLDAKETGLLEFLACYATGGSVWSQAKGHMYGSHNLGNGKEDIYGAIAICEAIENKLGIKVNREPKENWTWTSKAEKW